MMLFESGIELWRENKSEFNLLFCVLHEPFESDFSLNMTHLVDIRYCI